MHTTRGKDLVISVIQLGEELEKGEGIDIAHNNSATIAQDRSGIQKKPLETNIYP